MVTLGSPSPKRSSGRLSQRRRAVNAVSCDCGDCGASFSTDLFLEENICINLFLSLLAAGLWKRWSSAYHPAALWLLGWELGGVGSPQMLVPTADAGTRGRGWYPLPGASLRHITALCSPAGKAPLSHTLVKNARVVAL